MVTMFDVLIKGFMRQQRKESRLGSTRSKRSNGDEEKVEEEEEEEEEEEKMDHWGGSGTGVTIHSCVHVESWGNTWMIFRLMVVLFYGGS